VLAQGRPRIINRIADRAGAILMAYNPGLEGGQAVAEILFGDVNPSGKLPITYPRQPNALLTYDTKLFETEDTGFGNKSYAPQFELGAGLSYTTFAYSDLRVDKPSWDGTGALTVSVTVRNTGARAGKEAVLLFTRDMVASVTPPGRRLRRFGKVHLDPGQSRTLAFTLEPHDLAFVGADGAWVVEPGEFRVMVGGLTAPFTLTRR
jgi:beta-glucosidase